VAAGHHQPADKSVPTSYCWASAVSTSDKALAKWYEFKRQIYIYSKA
jgi:nickel-dependent lactate racemase